MLFAPEMTRNDARLQGDTSAASVPFHVAIAQSSATTQMQLSW